MFIKLINALLSDYHGFDTVFLDFLYAVDDVVACDLELPHMSVYESRSCLRCGDSDRWQDCSCSPIGTNSIEKEVVREVW
jgi:hypothetical protein